MSSQSLAALVSLHKLIGLKRISNLYKNNSIFRYQLDGYCLAILFSSKVFQGKVLGLSWRANTATKSGVCQSRTNVGTNLEPEMRILYSLFITMRTKHMKRIPLRMGVLNLAHEVREQQNVDYFETSITI